MLPKALLLLPQRMQGHCAGLHAPGSVSALQFHDFPGVSGFWKAHAAFWTSPLQFLEKSASGEEAACVCGTDFCFA